LASSGEVPATESGALELQEAMRADVLNYVGTKFAHFDPKAHVSATFETSDGSVAADGFDLEVGNLWGMRFTEPDAQRAGRTWTVEVSLGATSGNLLFGCRLSCFSRDYDFGFQPAVPAVLRDIVKDRHLASYGFMLSSSPATIESNADVEGLEALLRSPRRWRNVIVASCDDDFSTLVDVDRLAFRLAGVAHVIRISSRASFELSDRIGSHLSVYDQGVRTYRPNFSEIDDWSRHPLLLRRQLQTLPSQLLQRVEWDLASDACRQSVEQEGLASAIPSFADIRAAAARSRLEALKKTGSSIEDELLAEQGARAAAQSQAEEALAMATQEEAQRRAIETERDNYKSQVFALRARLEALESRNTDTFIEVSERPTRYAEFAKWVQTNFAGKLVLHARAARAVKDAVYDDINALCDAVQLLAVEYRRVLLGDQARDEYEVKQGKLGMSMSGSISQERAAEQGDNYFILWNNQRRFLHGHLSKGNSREERYCLRVYFFWSEEEALIVVGWLPSHLPNKLS